MLRQGSSSGRSQTAAVRLEIVGWAVLFLAAIVWIVRDRLPMLAATQVTASASLSMLRGASDAPIRQAFAVVRNHDRVAVSLVAESDPALRGISHLTVTADTPEQAKRDLTDITDAIRAEIPAGERDDLRALPDNLTYPAPNDTTQRLRIASRILAVLLILTAQILIVLGAYRQRGTVRVDLFMKLAMPFLFILLPAPDSSGPAGIVSHAQYSIPPDLVTFMPVMLAVSVIPLLLIFRLTRRSKPVHQ
ncbi:MAG TPA: hypothetical protein VKH35_11310 [Thermoanaerobaculia bacterium]|nr:hypothetical protein [Thermoanaerobaculia bacterium]